MDAVIAQNERDIRGFIGTRSGPDVLSRTTIDDLYQETVIEALRSADSFAEQGRLPTLGWLKVIASRVISDSLRRRSGERESVRIKRMGSTGEGVSETRLLGPGGTPSSVAVSSEQRILLRNAINALPDRYREVLRLYRIEEMSLAAVAAELRITKNATARLLERALRALRTRLMPE